MDKNRYPSVQQEFERLFPSTTGGGRGGESRELSVGESSASTTTDTNTGFATPSNHKTDNYRNMWIKNLYRPKKPYD